MFDRGEVGRPLLTIAPLSRILSVVAVMVWLVLLLSFQHSLPSLGHASLY